MISWLFEIDALKLSTKEVIWDSVTYSRRIITESFSGISMRWDISGNGLIAPNEMTFEVSNTDTAYTVSQFEDKFCVIRLIVDEAEVRTWKFKIDRALAYYGKIACTCVDFLQEYLVGDYPNTKSPKEIWPSSDVVDDSDSYCVPVILGVAYIPVMSVNTGSDRYYVLGDDSPTYTVVEVMSPRDWPSSSTWAASSYDMEGSTSSGYQLLQPIIASSVEGEEEDSPGLWKSGDAFYNMLCRYSRDDTVSLTNPAEWVEFVLEDFGIASADIDSTSFAAADTLYDTLNIRFDGGGWWEKESRESVLSNLLAQTDSFLKCSDKIELYQFDKTSKETITNVLLLSFSPLTVTKSTTDSGSVHWPESASKPSDALNGQAVVPTHDSGTELTTSSDILECRFLAGQSVNAQKAGILYFQKKYEQTQRISFSVTFSSLTSGDTLSPGDVVTVDNALYGGTNEVVITEMNINPDMKVDFTGVVLNYLEDWGDLTTSAIDVVVDTSSGFQIATTDYNGNLVIDVEPGADWETNLLNIPDRFKETASLGINVTDDYIGFYDGTEFQSFIQSNGNVQFGDVTTGQGFTWNQGTGVCTIQGSITIVNPAAVRTTLNVADGATRNTGALADLNSITNDYVTSIDGGKITTGTVNAARIYISSSQISDVSANADHTASVVGSVAYLNSITNDYVTSIDGGKITTGTVNAARISISSSQISDVGANADNTANNLGARLSTIYNDSGTLTLSSAKIEFNSLGGVKVNSGGGLVLAGNDSTPGKLVFDGSSTEVYVACGGTGNQMAIWPSSASSSVMRIGYNVAGSAAPFQSIYLRASYGTFITAGALFVGSPGAEVGTQIYGTINSLHIIPFSNDQFDLGSASFKWDDVYATNGTIQTSDAADKKEIANSDLGLDFIKELQPKKWIWNKGTRPHYGLVAQDIEEVIQKGGYDFAGLIKNNQSKVLREKELHKKTEEEQKSKGVVQEEITILTDEVKEGDTVIESFDTYGLRYTEFIGPMIKAIQELETRLTTIESKGAEK